MRSNPALRRSFGRHLPVLLYITGYGRQYRKCASTHWRYLHAHLGIKEKALARAQMPSATPGRYRPPDALLSFLESL